jgi:hypothetical protein
MGFPDTAFHVGDEVKFEKVGNYDTGLVLDIVHLRRLLIVEVYNPEREIFENIKVFFKNVKAILNHR